MDTTHPSLRTWPILLTWTLGHGWLWYCWDSNSNTNLYDSSRVPSWICAKANEHVMSGFSFVTIPLLAKLSADDTIILIDIGTMDTNNTNTLSALERKAIPSERLQEVSFVLRFLPDMGVAFIPHTHTHTHNSFH